MLHLDNLFVIVQSLVVYPAIYQDQLSHQCNEYFQSALVFSIVLFKLAVSQFTKRFTELRISRTIRISSNLKSAL